MTDYSVIFDLDGTLLNSLEDLADSVNTVLARQGLPIHPVHNYRWFVGDGQPMLVKRALPKDMQDKEFFEYCLQEVRQEYSKRWASKTTPYPGVLQTLKALDRKNMPMAVLSNKPHDATLQTVEHFFPKDCFSVVRGALPDKPVKPDPHPALEVAASLGLDPCRIYFVGDSSVDMFTARAAGMIALGAAWGFRGRQELMDSGADQILTEPLELLKHV